MKSRLPHPHPYRPTEHELIVCNLAVSIRLSELWKHLRPEKYKHKFVNTFNPNVD